MNPRRDSTLRRCGCRAIFALGLLVLATPSEAAYGLDRWYQMGDDPLEPASNGGPVGFNFGGTLFSLDSADPTGGGSFQDLEVAGTPVYRDISSDRPFNSSSSPDADQYAIEFSGSGQYLFGQFLNHPQTADATSGQPENYAGISDRGYQGWFKPSNVMGAAQFTILDDADQHRTYVSPSGNVAFEVGTSSFVTGQAAGLNQWTHFAQIRPAGNNGGSRGYVNGRALVSQTGVYAQGSLVNLAVGANVEGPANSQTYDSFFEGLISDVEMFVFGGTFGAYDYTTDNGYFTDVFLPSQSGYSYADGSDPGNHNDNLWVKGDINFDGVLDVNDITAFIAGWKSASDLPGAGPDFGDYFTLGLGDLDFDGGTDIDDWIALRNTGIAAGIAAFSAVNPSLVPEPSAACIALSLLFGMGLLSRQRPRRGGRILE